VLPSVRRQPPLPRDRLKALRAESEELAKSKKLVRVQVGAKGLNAAVVASAADALAGAPSGLVRIRLGDGCGLERRSAAVAMERLLDAVCVKQVGFCVTLYRDKALPRPDNVPPAAAGGGGSGACGVAVAAAAAEDEEEEEEAEALAATRRKTSSSKGGGRKKSLGDGEESSGSNEKKAKPPPSPPPAFTVV
jgi:RNA-binding protein YhbY